MSKTCINCNLENSSLDSKKSGDELCLLCKKILHNKKHCERSKKYYQKNKDKKKEYDKKRYLKTRGKDRLRREEWIQVQSQKSLKNKIKKEEKFKIKQFKLDQIKKLCEQKLGSRKIAKIIGINRSTVIKYARELNINISNNSVPKKERPKEIKCIICKSIKLINLFAEDKKHYTLRKKYCLECKHKYGVKDCERCINNNWCEEDLNKKINNKLLNKREYLKKWVKNKKSIDINFKLRSIISNTINNRLKRNLSSKNNKSCLPYLPYTIDELKIHLESQFEPWMNWNNWGRYDAKQWKDEDKSTWTWQIDHIIPQSIFKYSSMEDESFKRCWGLKNLRPLSSKKNILDGVKRIRHISE